IEGVNKMRVKKLLVFTQMNCPNCPTMKKITLEVGKKLNIPVELVDITNSVPESLEFDLLQNQIYISSTPSVVLVNEDGSIRELVLGEIIYHEELERRIFNQE
ncbi:MAG: conjugal transfer protein TraF, partial [Candidatus Bathyarchaeia archaeon]